VVIVSKTVKALRRLAVCVIIAVLSVLCAVGAYAAVEPTVLYRASAQSTVAASPWKSNNVRCFSVNTLINRKNYYYIIWSNGNNTASYDALDPGEHFYFETSGLSVSTAGYASVTLNFRYALNTVTYMDLDISMFGQLEVYLSCDNGVTWSKAAASLAAHRSTGEYFYASPKNGVYSVYGYVLECESTDLKKIAPSAVITNVRVYPYGKTLMRGGAFRIFDIEILGHRSDGTLLPALSGKETSSDISALRQKVTNHMREMATVKWTPSADINGRYPIGGGEYLYVNYKAGTVYSGMPYIGIHDGTLDEFSSNINSSGVYTNPDYVTGGDFYVIGNDCSSSVHQAWSQIYPVNFRSAKYALLTLHNNAGGVVPKGSYSLGTLPVTDTLEVLELNGRDKMFEAYATLEAGDGMIRFHGNGHMRLVSAAATVVRSGGKIDGSKSYVTVIENAGAFKQFSNSNWTLDYKYTFDQLYNTNYIPITCAALTDGKSFKPCFDSHLIPDAVSLSGGLSGTVESNYRIEAVTVSVETPDRRSIFTKTYPVSFRYFALENASDASDFIAELADGKYILTVTASAAGEKKEVFSRKFTVGDAKDGDFNCDGSLNVLDCIWAKAALDAGDGDRYGLAVGDLSRNGVFGTEDIKTILSSVLK